MDNQRLERIEKKLDDTNDHLSSISITLTAQHISLKEHIRRTNLLESDMVPIKAHIQRVDGAVRLIKILSYIAGIVEVIRLFR